MQYPTIKRGWVSWDQGAHQVRFGHLAPAKNSLELRSHAWQSSSILELGHDVAWVAPGCGAGYPTGGAMSFKYINEGTQPRYLLSMI